VAVVLDGSRSAPRAIERRVVALSDPDAAETKQPYHHGFYTHEEDAREIARRVAVVERCAKQSVGGLVRELNAARAALVVGSVIDPATVGNPHIRAHAHEGQLFRTVLEAALREHRIECEVIVDKQLAPRASKELGRPAGAIARTVSGLGKTLGGPWRAEEKAAATAAWLVLPLVVLLMLAALAVPAKASAQTQPALQIPAAAQTSPRFDPDRATQAYLDSLPPDKKARSDSYFEGGYWLQLWNFLYGTAVLWAFLSLGWSAAMRDRAEQMTRRRPLQTLIYWLQFNVVLALATFPWTFYADFYREHQYGLATQTFWPWMWDQVKGFGVALVFGGVVLVTLYGVLRRVGRSWWLWASAVVVAFSVIGAVIAPVFIAPLFNSYTRLTDPAIRDPILRIARANGIDADAVYVVDQSRQTTRVSANVSGFLGTRRISLNDNLLKRGSVEEIEAVLGHEMGHYVLNHVLKNLLETSLVIAVGFALVAAAFEWFRRRHGEWRIASVGDVAGLPLIAVLFSVYSFATTPINNTIIRETEHEADMFGLNAARQPDGFASAALKLGEYRKLSPGPIEEFIFFDHPSGRTRIHNAMVWKAGNLDE
jgi:STE24 endopeptidase